MGTRLKSCPDTKPGSLSRAFEGVPFVPKFSPLTTTFLSSPRSNECARKRGPGLELQMATRRAFMKGGAMALVGTSVVPTFLQRSVLAQTTSAQAQGKKLVVIFQRGAADGLNIVVPHAETQLLPAPADDRHPAKPAHRPGRILRTAPGHAILQTPIRSGASGHGPGRRLARHHPLALRRPGLHGERHPRREGDPRWLAEPRFAGGRSSPAGRAIPPFARSRSAPRCRARWTGKSPQSRSTGCRISGWADKARMPRRSAPLLKQCMPTLSIPCSTGLARRPSKR